MSTRAKKEPFLDDIKSELSEVQLAGVSLGIDCLIENESSHQDLPIVVASYDDRDRDHVLDFLIKFFQHAYPHAKKDYLLSEPLSIGGTSESDALLNLINMMRFTGRLLFYWADSPSWFRQLPSNLFHVVEIGRRSARRGKNCQGEVQAKGVTKEYSNAQRDLPLEMFGLVNFGSMALTAPSFNAHELFHEEADSKIIRPIPAPATLHFDKTINIHSPLWQKQACVALRRYQARECNDGFSWDESNAGWENIVVHPFLDEIRLCDGDGLRECLVGQVTMVRSSDDSYYLSTVWLHPFYRRKGKLRDLWPELQELYGDFEIEQPNDSMRAFLMSVQ